MSSRKLQQIIKTQKVFIKELLDRLVDKDVNNTLGVISDNFFMRVQNKNYSLKIIKILLNDPYFDGLTLEQILELAKKSIRITTENRQLEDKLENIKFKIKDLRSDLCDNCGWRNTDNCDPINSGYVCSDLLEILSIIEDKENGKTI